MNFGHALEALKAGKAVARDSWQYLAQQVYLQRGYPDGIGINANTATAVGRPEGTICIFEPYLMYQHPDRSFGPWSSTHADLLADDWTIVSP